MKKPFTLGSLFDGSGGFPLAGCLCGISPTWASEVEPYPIAVTSSRFPYLDHLGDISKIDGATIPPVDVITFGSPCQDLSVAGKRAGLKHEEKGDETTTRSGLFMEAVRIIKEMRRATNGKYPTFALWENVPGAFSSNKGEDFRIVLEELIKISEPDAAMPPVPKKGWPYADCYVGDGFSVAYRTLDAQYWGVHQRRRRIYLVADFRGERAGKILFERKGLRRHTQKSREKRQGTAADAEESAGAADTKTDGSRMTPESPQNNNHETPPSYTLKIRQGCEGGGKGALIQTNKSGTLSTNNDQYLFQPIQDTHILDDQGGSQINVRNDGKSPTLRAETHGNLPCVIENHPADSRVNIDDSGTVQCLTGRMGTGGGNVPMVLEEKPEIINLNKGDVQSKTVLDPDGIAPSLYAGECRGGGGEMYVLDKKDPIICLEGNGARPSHQGNGYSESDKMYTLTSGDHHAVAIGNGQLNQISMSPVANTRDCMHDKQAVLVEQPSKCNETVGALCARDYKGFGNQYVNEGKVIIEKMPNAVCYEQEPASFYPQMKAESQCFRQDGKANTLVIVTNPGYQNGVVEVKPMENQYIVRRLTPTECCRLQGFPDGWGEIDPKEDFTDEEYKFWYEVRNTHAAINGRKQQAYTKQQMLTWYNKLHADSAEYKMWGNGIALPTALYVMEGIADALREQETENYEKDDCKGTCESHEEREIP